MAALVLVAFQQYLRISEALDLRVGDVAFQGDPRLGPARGHGSHLLRDPKTAQGGTQHVLVEDPSRWACCLRCVVARPRGRWSLGGSRMRRRATSGFASAPSSSSPASSCCTPCGMGGPRTTCCATSRRRTSSDAAGGTRLTPCSATLGSIGPYSLTSPCASGPWHIPGTRRIGVLISGGIFCDPTDDLFVTLLVSTTARVASMEMWDHQPRCLG
eukprot:jgi/Mesvir1/8934/Mv26125-RA.1